MSDQSERIRAALLRFEAARSTSAVRQVEPTQPEGAARQLVVVNEQNLAALFQPERKLAASKGG
jgi:hypothetical protein